MEHLLSRMEQRYKQQLAVPEDLMLDPKPGKLAYVEGSSRHIHGRFWAGRYEETARWRKIHNLKYLLDEPASTASDFLFSNPSFTFEPDFLSPSQSDFLVQSYVLYVDPFIRVSHKPSLLFELNHFRRGILPDRKEFGSELSVIHALGLVPLPADDCMLQFGVEKSLLMKNFKDAANRGLAQLNVAASHKIRNLRTFLLYIHEGAESMLSSIFYDTALPQCSDDAEWDACEFALEEPSPSTGFTDMTGALVQYEIASVMRALLNHTAAIEETETSLKYQQDIIQQARQRIDRVYLNDLDSTLPSQKIVNDLTTLAFEGMFLGIHQALFKHGAGGVLATSELQSVLFDRAIAYCETVQRLREEYTPHNLDWIFVRYFSWDGATIMLTSVMRNHSLDQTERGRRARGRIDILFRNRHAIDFLAGNANLWAPLQKLWEELEALDCSASVVDNSVFVGEGWPLDSTNLIVDFPFSLD
ncbi:hypothetical protein EG327_005202 [Venturia inaequalis]|uniref:Uncharacterized protein n=1 Tax=Venturia inaequalis TaxID=5025 RepID=A0A8H3ZIT3_VENIN|nr:hypothetical protein EG327_005202 [Venturia inaequalis]